MKQTVVKRGRVGFQLFIAGVLCCGICACSSKPAYRVRVVNPPVGGSELKGTQKPYEVNGERFEPLHNAEGYREEGTASWYGADFHGRKTSNGEIYDMHDMTAAHKTLPMNVYVQVTNKANGRRSVVRINDRGPFVRGRIIDLSYAAAKELEVVGPGTAPVVVETLGYREVAATGSAPVYRQPVSYDAGPFTVQVGAFTIYQNAERLAGELQAAYGAATTVEGWVGGKKFYRVRVGLYNSLNEAEQARVAFESRGFRNSFVVARD